MWQQNRHQKVFNRGLCICAVGLDVLNFEQILLFYSVSYFNLERAWSFVSEWLSPPTPPPWWRNSVATLQLASYCKWLGKVRKLRDMSSLQDMSNFLCKHDRAQSTQPIQVVSILLHEAKTMLGLFCLQLNIIGWSGRVTNTIRRDNWLGFKSLWLRFRINDFSQVLGSSFSFNGSVFRVRV